jgi:copper chaperone CopZ
VAHDIPGRIRFGIPSLKGNGAATLAVAALVEALEGVTTARVNMLTGSLIVEYDGAIRTRERIFVALVELGYHLCARNPTHTSAKTGASWDATLAGAIGKALVHVLLEDALYLAVAGVL